MMPKFTVVNLKPPCDHLTASNTREQDRFIKLRLKYLHIHVSDFYTVYVITFFVSTYYFGQSKLIIWMEVTVK